MDMTESIAARSDQVNADDLAGGPQTVTIREVIKGKAESPFDFLLVEIDRAYRPNKTMRRVIVAAWGKDTKAYAGRRLTLYREPTIQFAGKDVGGIRISAMSHLTEQFKDKFQTKRGVREEFIIQPLPDAATVSPAATVDPETERSLADLRARYEASADEVERAGILAERDRLTGGA